MALRIPLKQARRGAFGLDGFAVERRGRFAVSSREARTVGETTFDSKAEAVRFAELQLLQRAGRIACLEVQPTWVVEIAGKRLCRYTADFSYLDAHGHPVIEDVKSSGTAKDAAYRLRKKAAELAHGITVVEVIR